MPFKVVLLRHGESVWNVANIFTGWHDVDLSEKGVQEAKEAGKCLKDHNLKFDVVFTSVLRRAIKTAWLSLMESDNYSMPVINSWRLNERHYGGLQGLNKAETAKKHGDEQVKIWRRSYDIPPPTIDLNDERHPANDPLYAAVPASALPGAESLKLTVQRVLPLWNDQIAPCIMAGRSVLVAAHGNSLRAICKHLEDMSEEEVLELNIPTGVPLVYELDDKLRFIQKYYLMDPGEVAKKIAAVASQGSSTKVATDVAPICSAPVPGGKFRGELVKNARYIASRGKGILASDESPGTCKKRFDDISLECTDENQRKYRELLYATPGIEDHISGVIMYDATFWQKTSDGTRFVDLLREKGILVGVKVDKGLCGLPGSQTGEQWTKGLDDLQVRCKKYYENGARFAKWRNVLKISKDGNPSDVAIMECTACLAKYASICQSEGLVPIVEPEVMLDGDHSIEVAYRVHQKVWEAQYAACQLYGILLEGSLFKPSMVVPGADLPKESPKKVAQYTIDALLSTVPKAMPGITFLSGGQSEEEATIHLNEMNRYKPTPWNVSFSFGRALQATVLKTWQGKDDNKVAAQQVLKAISMVNGMAAMGEYDEQKGHPSTSGSLYVKGYTY